MRKTIRQMLVDSVSQVEGRVYEPHAAGPKVKKPYLVLKEGTQDPGADWSGFATIIEVWPFVARTTFQQVDSLVSQVVDALHRARFAENGEQYLVDYLGSAGPDFVDTEWDAITRGLRFQVFALGWLHGLTFEPDPVAALKEWTITTWPEIHTDPATWDPMDTTPGIYWRLVQLLPAKEATAAVTWMDAQIAGHILAPSAAVRLHWIRSITEGLARERRIRLSDGSPLFFTRVAADSEADPMRKGQIRLTARFGVLQPKPAISVLRRGVISGDAQGEVK